VLPSRFQGIQFQSRGDAVHYVGNPEGVCQSTQRQVIDEVRRMNGLLADETRDPEIATRIAQYELAFKMQSSVPELTDFKNEPQAMLDLYGVKEPGDGSFASNCILARRLAERGVRMIQLYHRAWDHHSDLELGMKAGAKEVDQATAALITDLKQRGMLDDTLILYMADNGLLNGEHGMVDKRTMHEPSIRIPIIARGPGLPAGKVVERQVVTEDIAPSILKICGAPALEKTHGHSWKLLCNEGDADWRTAWLYEYNYEKQCPYTPNIRGIRTDRFKFAHYPHGDGTADRHLPEMYDLAADPDERNNLAVDPAHAATRADLERQLATLLASFGLTPEKDTMPLDEGIKSALPDQKIR
jgi:hypothetical protein